jgi:arsenite methyltransferase
MSSDQEIKQMVREKYGAIAGQAKEKNQSSCCGGTGCCSTPEFTVMAEDYTKLPGYVADADLALGCGLPTEFAQIRKGDTVVDLGSGAGNDAFIARSIVGDTGRVIGIDMTEEMVAKARANARKLDFSNVDFILSDIENIMVESGTADVVVSNCVMNLVPDKQKAFAETFRILKKGGHFSISDIVLRGELPEKVRESASLYAGCIAGARQIDDYLQTIKDAGFVNVTIQKDREIVVPNEILIQHISLDDLREFKRKKTGIYSITVYAEKP